MAALAAVAALAGCASPLQPVAPRAEALMQDLHQRHRFQGAVVMSREGRVEYAAGFGFADVERQLPFTPDTLTDGASIAKTFTAAALLMLVDQGRIGLDVPVRSVIPEYPHAKTTLRHLLTHSAGLVDYDWLDAHFAPRESRTNASQLARVARDAPVPNFEPGSAFAYDNLAYDAAAMVIERIEGLSYAGVIANRFSRPLKMMAFVRPERFADWPGARTRGYRRTAEGWKDHDALDGEGFYGGSNLYLSAYDLHRWVAGYAGVVGAATSRAAVAPARLDDGRSTGISMGSWFVSDGGRKRYYTGSHNGFFSFGYADEARNIAIAWVANDAPPAWLQPALSRALIAMAEGRALEPLVAPPAADPGIDPSGTYRVNGVGEVTVQRDGRQLRVRVNEVEYQGFPVARGVHYVPGVDAYLRFSSVPLSQVSMTWDSVYLVASATPALERGTQR